MMGSMISFRNGIWNNNRALGEQSPLELFSGKRRFIQNGWNSGRRRSENSKRKVCRYRI